MNEGFLNALREEFEHFAAVIADDSGAWIVKGFIDVYRNYD